MGLGNTILWMKRILEAAAVPQLLLHFLRCVRRIRKSPLVTKDVYVPSQVNMLHVLGKRMGYQRQCVCVRENQRNSECFACLTLGLI